MGASSTSPAPTVPDESAGSATYGSVGGSGLALQLVERDKNPAPCIGVDGTERSSVKLPLHERLPVEIIQHIFILRAQTHEEVYLPFRSEGVPPQQIVSHVCSEWRRIALTTGELWNDVMIVKFDENTVETASTWLGRAKNMSVVLKLCLLKTVISDLARTIETLCQPLRLKRIEMMLSSCQLAELSKIPDKALAYLEETRVILHAQKYTPTLHLESFVSRVNLLLCASGPCLDLLRFGCLPMDKMRHLDIRCVEMTPTQIVSVLRGATSLESCRIIWYWEWEGVDEPLAVTKDVILPNMKILILEFHRQRRSSIVFDAIGRSLVFPNLQKLSLRYRGFASSMLPLMSARFNFSRLEELELRKTGSTTASEVLRCAPLLRRCAFSKNVEFDEDAMVGLSTGSLGRLLVSITTNSICDVRKMSVMAVTRHRDAREDGGSHQKMVPFQYLNFRTSGDDKEYLSDLDPLKELGVKIVVNGPPQDRLRISDTEIPDMWSKFFQSPKVY